MTSDIKTVHSTWLGGNSLKLNCNYDGCKKLHDDSWWWLRGEMVMLSGVGWLQGEFSALCFSSFFFFYFFLFSLWIYYPSSTLSIYSTLRRENCRCSQRLQSFRKSVGCNISQMRAISLSGAAHVFSWSEKTQFSKELKCAWRNSTPWGCLWIVGHGCAAPSLAGSWTRGYWVLLQLV